MRLLQNCKETKFHMHELENSYVTFCNSKITVRSRAICMWLFLNYERKVA